MDKKNNIGKIDKYRIPGYFNFYFWDILNELCITKKILLYPVDYNLNPFLYNKNDPTALKITPLPFSFLCYFFKLNLENTIDNKFLLFSKFKNHIKSISELKKYNILDENKIPVYYYFKMFGDFIYTKPRDISHAIPFSDDLPNNDNTIFGLNNYFAPRSTFQNKQEFVQFLNLKLLIDSQIINKPNIKCVYFYFGDSDDYYEIFSKIYIFQENEYNTFQKYKSDDSINIILILILYKEHFTSCVYLKNCKNNKEKLVPNNVLCFFNSAGYMENEVPTDSKNRNFFFKNYKMKKNKKNYNNSLRYIFVKFFQKELSNYTFSIFNTRKTQYDYSECGMHSLFFFQLFYDLKYDFYFFDLFKIYETLEFLTDKIASYFRGIYFLTNKDVEDIPDIKNSLELIKIKNSKYLEFKKDINRYYKNRNLFNSNIENNLLQII